MFSTFSFVLFRQRVIYLFLVHAVHEYDTISILYCQSKVVERHFNDLLQRYGGCVAVDLTDKVNHTWYFLAVGSWSIHKIFLFCCYFLKNYQSWKWSWIYSSFIYFAQKYELGTIIILVYNYTYDQFIYAKFVVNGWLYMAYFSDVFNFHKQNDQTLWG